MNRAINPAINAPASSDNQIIEYPYRAPVRDISVTLPGPMMQAPTMNAGPMRPRILRLCIHCLLGFNDDPDRQNEFPANINWEIIEYNLKQIVAKVGVNDIIDYAEAVEHMHEIGKMPRKPGKKSPYLYPSIIKNQKFINDQIKEATIEGFKA